MPLTQRSDEAFRCVAASPLAMEVPRSHQGSHTEGLPATGEYPQLSAVRVWCRAGSKGATSAVSICSNVHVHARSQTPLDHTPGPRNAQTKYSAPDLSLRMHTWMRPSGDLRHLA